MTMTTDLDLIENEMRCLLNPDSVCWRTCLVELTTTALDNSYILNKIFSAIWICEIITYSPTVKDLYTNIDLC